MALTETDIVYMYTYVFICLFVYMDVFPHIRSPDTRKRLVADLELFPPGGEKAPGGLLAFSVCLDHEYGGMHHRQPQPHTHDVHPTYMETHSLLIEFCLMQDVLPRYNDMILGIL